MVGHRERPKIIARNALKERCGKMKNISDYIQYVVGFVFRRDRFVLLVEKQNPDWQAGKLNGVGGKLKVFESPEQAMVREFKEHTGVLVRGWTRYCVITEHKRKSIVYCFYTHNDVVKAQQMEEEILIWVSSYYLPKTGLPDLKWLIPMAICGTCYAEVEQK